ncbi:DUF559 domain-containing protein [Nakamurella sp. YIM 132087]|uniref:DUF559 domain-containing protein n=1 Tax=Nakamurella alba TaxID=2665158 RepID=A0A7K1FMF3_9ACTN|nr:DUF559 domain-containing protein [Nakamurella alba]
MDRQLRDRVDRRLRRQWGVISRRQALAVGMSEDQVDRLVQAGVWLPMHPGVYRSSTNDTSVRAEILAAGLWAGDRGVLDGWAAAWWWGLTDQRPPVIELAVHRRSHLRPRPGVALVSRTVADVDVLIHTGIRIVDRPTAVMHAAVVMGADGVRLLDRQLQQRTVDLSQITAVVEKDRNRRGNKVARRLIELVGDGAAAESERRCIRLLRQAGIKGWEVGREVTIGARRYVLDLAFVRERIAVEIDGLAWHTDPDRFQTDRRRQNELINAGWRVLRFTWYELVERPGTVLASIRTALDARRQQP